MSRLGLFVTGCVILAACDEDPARSVRIIARPPMPAAQAAKLAASSHGGPTWRPEMCAPLPASTAGEGTFVTTGACAFEQRDAVTCAALGDDFFVDFSRPSAMGTSLHVFINVERYRGPGKYTGSSLLFSIRNAHEVYPWHGHDLTMTVGDGERFVTVESASLPPGFMRGAGPVQAQGKLWCKAKADSR